MRIKINTSTYSISKRMMSAFLAFLIVVLTFQQAFVNMSIMVKAAGIPVLTPNLTNGKITSSSNQISSLMGQTSGTGAVRESHSSNGTTVNGTYTGRIKPTTVSMYDYRTDNEIKYDHLGGENTSGDAQLYDANYTWYSRYDPYTIFNNAISTTGFTTTTILSDEEDNITIKYYGLNKFASNETVYIYLWQEGTANQTAWTEYHMSFDSVNNCFYFTFSTTNSSYVGFTPNRIIFHNNSSKKSPDILQTMSAGNTYTFTENTSDGVVNYRLKLNSSNTDAHIHLYKKVNNVDTPLAPWRGMTMNSDGDNYYSYSRDNEYNYCIFNGDWGQYPGTGYQTNSGYTYYYNWGNTPPDFITWPNLHLTQTTGSEDITETTTDGFASPLYTGYFIDPDGSGRPSYNNFYWMPNLAQTSGTNGSNSDAAVQNLVENTLNAAGLVQKDGIALPYFDSTWASNHKYSTSNQTYSASGNKEIMKCWESTDSKTISFPFYETLTRTTSDNQYAKYYQFNSKDSTVVFNSNDASPADSYFTESSTVIKDTYGGSAFFPYNTVSSWHTNETDGNANTVGTNNYNRKKNGEKNNYGFGAKFEMSFKLSANGMTEAVDENGKKITTTGTVDTVPTVFEFNGDDDLWVFIDGNLVLDIGGDHGASSGKIDFSTGTAKVDKLVQYNDTNKDALNATIYTNSTTSPNVVSLEGKVADLSMSGGTPTYDTGTTHTMTIFYMERGMAQSNLFVRYNFVPEDTFSKMKIKEQTNFSTVNAGLKAITQKAAENDVFKYTVSNSGTLADDVYQNTYVNKAYTRTVQDTNTVLTSAETITGKNFDPTSSNTVANVAYNWVDEYAFANGEKMESGLKAAGFTGSSGELYLMHGIPADPILSTPKETKSSAEFEGQFKRYSTMTITQDTQLYTPNRSTTPATLSAMPSPTRTLSTYYTPTKYIFSNTDQTLVQLADNVTSFKLRNDINENNIMEGDATSHPDTGVHINSAAQMTELFVNTVNTGAISVTKNLDPDDDVQDEFEFQVQFSNVFGNGVTVPDDGYGSITIGGTSDNATTLTSDGKFKIKKGNTATISGIPVGTHYVISEASSNYQLKEVSSGSLTGDKTDTTQSATVVNTRRLGTLTLTKDITGEPTANSFTFTGTLTGPSGVLLNNYASGISGATLGDYNSTNNSYPFTATVTVGTPTVISGIPYGTAYTVDETLPAGAISRELTSGCTGNVNSSTPNPSATITNNYPTDTPVTVVKTGSTGDDDLSGAELELWYKETITPSTYSYNDPTPVPSQKMNGLTVTDTDKTVGVPGLAVTTEKTKKYTNSAAYANPTVPNSDEKEWILPRNDSDYIYFRDYNVGQYAADKDAVSFNNTTGNRSWVQTTFANNGSGTHYQDQELGFTNQNLWVAAQFTGNGKQMVQYAVWERFVDKFTYTDHNNTSQTVDTVVWKIQPPDGYTQVRFLVYDGGNCIRTTEQFTYQLGKIYHKTNWGGSYSPAYGGSYYDVPVNKNDAPLWAPAYTEYHDQRNTAMEQARKYEPTEQKVIFTCDSSEVWHNIHIEFFTYNESNSTYERVNGQPFPGYMMEPYAYAQSNYRLPGANDHQYLTYELTIPKGATHFRINNGVDNSPTKGSYSLSTVAQGQSPYAFRTKITELKKTNGTKNFDNYYAFSSTVTNTVSSLNSGSPYAVPLVKATSDISALSGENTTKTYSTVEVESDYDFIYFEWPSSWGSTPGKVYAYFYGGGNLREDNWQRACYSAWPGVAPVGTEYVSGSTNVYSTTYTYPTDSKYNGNSATSAAIPEATFTSGGKTIYRFRIPKGDRKNYSKVVFNNGLSSQSGGQETGVIEYKRGYIYNKHGKATKHYENSPTISYTASTVSDNIEYIFVQNGPNWSDLHVTFYDANGGQILQGGSGYLMEYAGSDYYKIPLPADAKFVSVNNGMNGSQKSEKAEIIRLDTDGSPKSTAAATDRFVYNLTSDKKLTRAGITTSSSYTEDENILPQEEVNTGYAAVRQTGGTDDVLYIRDEYGWNAAIGAVSVKFYKADGTSAGSGVMMKTNPDSDGKVWYTKKIPTDAVSFVVGYYNGSSSTSTPSYPIYPTTGDGNKTTSGNMFYKTASASTLEITHANAASTPVNDETYDQRGDDLYLVKSDSGAMKVTFYGAGDVTIRSGITAKYINVDNSDHWFKVSIPTGAKSFSIDPDSSTKYDIYELKAKYSPYEKDYTVGDMQYRVGNTTPLYPVFTEDDEYTTELGGKEISSRSPAPQVEDSAVESYATANAYTLPTSSASSPADTPVLYETSVDDVKYKWTEGSGSTTVPDNDYIWFDDTNTSWGNSSHNNIRIKFSDSEGSGADTDGTMSYNSVSGLYYYTVPTNDNYQTVEIWQSESHSTKYVTLSNELNAANYYGRSCNVTVTVNSGASGYVWYLLKSGDGTHNNMSAYFYNSSDGTWTRSGNEGGQKSVTINNETHQYFKFPIPSNVSNYDRLVIFNDQVNYKYFTKTSSNYYYSINNSNSYGSGLVLRGTDTYSSHKNWADNNEYYYGCISKSPRVYVSDNVRDVEKNNSENPNVQWRVVENVTSTYASYLGTTTYAGSIGSPSTHQEGSSTDVTYTYQPEDHYGMISVDNSASTPVTLGTADVNDFIKIVGANDLYIKFFDAQNNELGTSDPNTNTKGLKIAYAAMVNTSNNTDYASSAQPGAGTDENPYMVRIPKGAQSFTVTNGDGTRSGTYDLSPSSITVNAEDGQLTSSGDQITLTDFYHAGSTFTVTNGSASNALNIALTDVRDGYTVARQTSMTDPLNPRTDADYIFFTDDSSNTFGGSGSTKTVYAYFYGDKDGEYTAWPGIKATTANTSVAETTYTDNAGRTVYMFRVPQTADGKYKYVIFNDGSTTNSRKITQAVQYVKGSNYYLVPSADNTTPYGTITSSTYAVTNENKATNASTVGYNTAGTNKYIYIINNGTKDLAGSTTTAAGTHTVLDEMHVTFFDGNKAPIGDGAPGYKPDRVAENVYRIQAPADAKYFQINNGANKGTGDPSKIRQSEIKQLSPNGLYKFVDAAYLTSLGKDNTVAANYIEGNSVPATANDRWKPNYLLALTNPRVMEDSDPPVPETYDVHIATVVTKANGTVDYIKWVKNSPSNIDSNYIANVSGDIGPSGNHTQNVKVVKQGDYYWKEVTPPAGYYINTTPVSFSVPGYDPANPPTVADEEIPTTSSVKLKKKLTSEKTDNDGESQLFIFKVTLTAPTGFVWTAANLPTVTGTGASIVNNTDLITGITRTFNVSVPADNTEVTISGIPTGTRYYIEEQPLSGYQSEPVLIQKVASGETEPNTVTEISGNDTGSTYTVTNKRIVGSLTLGNTDDGALGPDPEANINQGKDASNNTIYTEFTYTVTLEVPDSDNNNTPDYDLRDYISWNTLTAANGYKATVKKINGTSVSSPSGFGSDSVTSIEYEVDLKANNGTKTLGNLPVGTKYTVKENAANTQRNSAVCTTSVTEPTGITGSEINSTHNKSITTSDLNPRVIIHNHYEVSPGSLVLEKATTGTLPSGMDADTYFAFHVTLSSDTSRDKITSGAIVTDTSGTLITGTTAITANTEFIVKLKAGSGNTVTISDLPAATTYTVTEDSGGNYYYDGTNAATQHNDTLRTGRYYNDDSSNTTSAAGSVPAGSSITAKVTNTYPGTSNSLVLQKTLGANAGAYGKDGNSEFTYNVTLTGTSGYTLTATQGSDAYTPSGLNSGSFDVVVTPNKAVTISGIPDGATYSVYEKTDDQPTGTTVKVTGSDPAVSVDSSHPTPTTPETLTGGTTKTVDLTNDFPAVGSLSMSKTVSGNWPHGTMPENYTFTLNLTIPTGVDASKLNITVTPSSAATLPAFVSGTQTYNNISVTVPNDGTAVTINNLPIGTTYTVSEEADTTYATVASVSVDGTALSGENVRTTGTQTITINASDNAHTAAITNTYPAVRDLTMVKAFDTAANATANNITNSFTFEAVLTPPSGMSLDAFIEKYLGADLSSDLASNDSASDYTDGTKYCKVGTTKVKRLFTVSTSSSQTISDLPVGTAYTVTEVGDDDAYRRVSVTASPDTNSDGAADGTITATANNAAVTATLTNKYPALGSLVLAKSMATGTSEGNDENTYQSFDFTVVLENDDVDLRDFIPQTLFAGYQVVSIPNDKYKAHRIEFTQSLKQNTASESRTLTGIPKGTKYTVTEAAVSGWKDAYFDYSNTTAGDKHLTSDTETVTVYNSKTGDLVLEKKMAPGTTDNATAQSFTLHVKLERPVTGSPATSTVDLTKFVSQSYLTGKGVNMSAASTTYSASTIEFDIQITKTNSITIEGLPNGTTYTVTEPTGSMPQYWKTAEIDYHGNTSHQISGDKTVSVYNAKTGHLTLHKGLANGTDPNKNLAGSSTGTSEDPLNKNKEFTFEVELNRPTNNDNTVPDIDLTEYLSKTPSDAADAGSITHIGGKQIVACSVYSASQIKFTIKVKNASDITFDNIPYGTTYRIKETDDLSSTNWVKLTDDGASSTDTNVYGTVYDASNLNVTKTASITNDLTGSLKIDKSIVNPTNSASTTVYNFTVTMSHTDSNIDWSKYTFTDTNSDTITCTSGVLSGITITGDGNVTISGIPYGTTCTVAETGSTPSGGYSTNITNNGQTVNDNTVKTTTVENTYSNLGSLTISKSILYYPDNASTAKTNKTYKVKVTLAGTNFNWTNVSITGTATTYTKPASYPSGGLILDIKKGTNIQITGLADGTTYTVQEVDGSGNTINTTYNGYTAAIAQTAGTGATQSDNVLSGELNSTNGKDHTVAITNTYVQTHELTLNKVESYNNTTSVPAGSKYVFTVTLANTSLNGGTLGSDPYVIKTEETVNETTTTNTVSTPSSFTVEVTPGTPVKITGIPHGTMYTVAETSIKKPDNTTVTYASLAGTGLTTSYQIGSADAVTNTSTGSQTLNADGSVTFTNIYPKVGSLKLKKTLDGGAAANVDGTTEFTYKVELTEPAGVTFSGNYSISGTSGIVAGIYDSENHKYTFYETVTDNTDVTISGIPYGTAYKVTEVYKKVVGETTTYETIANDPKHPQVTPANVTGAIGEHANDTTPSSDSEAEITNTYRKLTLSKALAGTYEKYGVDGTTTFKYKFKLTNVDLTASGYGDIIKVGSTNISTMTHVDGWYSVSVSEGTSVVITGLPKEAGYQVYESEALPAGVTVKNNSTYVSSGAPVTGSLTSASATVTLTNTYPATGGLTLKKDFTTDTNPTSADKALEFIYEIKFTAPDHAKFNDTANTYTVSPSGKVVSGYPQFSDNDTKMTYRVQVSKDQSDLAQNAGVTISGLPNGTTYTVEEKNLGSGDFTNWKYVKTDYTSTTSPAQNIASSETETAAIINTKVTNLTITKSVDTASGDGNGVTFTYVVTLTTPTGITRDQLKTILGNGWTDVENSSTDVYNSFTIKPVTNNAGSYSTSVPNIPYGTEYTVTESELSGWLNIAKSGDTGTISSTASTAIFTNAQKNDLTLTKTLATGTPNTETGKMFLYEVTLKAPTGMEFTKTSVTGTALKLYVKNSTNGVEQEIEINPQTLSYSGGFTNEKFYGDNIDIGTASDSRSTATFKLHLSSNLADGRKIKNLPYGTDYTVTEDTTEFPAVPSTGTSWKQLSTDPSGTINASASTANIKNGLVGSLTITKTVSGSAPKTAKTYPFVVELSRDDTLDLNDYSVTGGETNWYSTTDKKGTINVSVSTITANASTTISNIPYGTKYKIYENTSGLPSFMTSSNPNSENAISNTTGVTGAHTETITNTYNTGSLKITKELAADSGATLPSGATEYTFTGTFTRNDSFDLDDYDFTATADGKNPPENTSVNVTFSKDAYDNTEGHRSGTFTATITIPADATISTTGSIVISGIPTGTNFTVQESSRRDNSTVSPASDSGSISTSGSTVEKIFTNTYHDTTTLKLAKSVTTTGTVPAAVYNQSTAEYTLLVTLQQPSGEPFSAFNIASTQTLYVVENGAVTSTQLDPHDIVSGTQFAVKLAYNGTVDISNLPAGTQYKVEEASASKANTTSYSGDVTTFTDIPAETHTVNNYYQSGSLKVRKTTEGTLPSSAPSNGQYSVTVTLDAPANVSDFANYSISPPTGATLDANSTATHRIYTVNVTANNNSEDWVEFSNLPYNTAYTVQEADQTSAGNPTVTYTSSKTGSISGTNTVVIKNSYLNTHKLTLSKSFGDTTSYAAKYGVTSTTRFKYHVTLSGLGTYTVNAESVDTDGTTVITDSHTPTSGNASFDVYVTSDQSVEISGLPDNAAYSVYEDTSYGASTYLPANVSISASGDGSGSGTSSSPMEGNMGTADKAVIITNTYTDTGSLTLKKIVANRTSSDGIADAKFDVTLLIPNSVTDIGQYNVSIEGSSSPYSNGLLTLSNPDTTTIAIKIINSKCHRI